MENEHLENASVFRAFSEENRLKILEELRSGEKCACVLLEKLDISQSTLSHHMGILCKSKIVRSRKSGKWTHYSIDQNGCNHAEKLMRRLTTVIDSKEMCCDEQ